MMPADIQASVFNVPLAFLWTALIVELTPGPNMTYLAVLSLSEGRRAGLSAVAGVAIGLLTVGVLAALGLAAVIAQSPALYQGLRWAGVIYLVWLAFDIWRGKGDAAGEVAAADQARTYFVRGLLTNLLNPKAAIFYVAVLPSFVDPDKPLLTQTLSMSAAYVAIATLIHTVIVLLAARFRLALGETGASSNIRVAFAIMVLAIAAWLAWSSGAVTKA